jgi:hypothetical protein
MSLQPEQTPFLDKRTPGALGATGGVDGVERMKARCLSDKGEFRNHWYSELGQRMNACVRCGRPKDPAPATKRKQLHRVKRDLKR